MIHLSARTEYGDAARLRHAADLLDRNFNKRRPTPFVRVGGGPVLGIVDFGDRKEVWTDDAIDCEARRLPDAACFQIEKSPYVADFQLSFHSRDMEGFAAWSRWIEANHGATWQSGLSTYAAAPDRASVASGEPIEASDYDLGFYAEAGKGVRLSWGVWGKLCADKTICRRFFETCVAACDLRNAVRLEASDKGFRITSDVYQLTVSGAMDGYNPDSVTVWISDASQAAAWSDHALTALGAARLGYGVSLHVSVEQYAAHRAAWNALTPKGSSWGVRLQGGYAAGFDPFTAALPGPDSEPRVYPLLIWRSGEKFYQCDLVTTHAGRYLEIITDVASRKRLTERLDNAQAGLPFQIVTEIT